MEVKWLKPELFVNRVLTSEHKVVFSEVDSNGHMHAPRYLEAILDHRLAAAEENVGFILSEMMKRWGLNFFVREVRGRYIYPAFLGEQLEIGSWTSALSRAGYAIKVIMWGKKNHRAHTYFEIDMVCVDVKSGSPKILPAELPGDEEKMVKRPLAEEYLTQIKGLPFDLFPKKR